MELNQKIYKSIEDNYTIHCENFGDFNSFKNLITNNQCFQKIDNLVINNISVTWCYLICISKYWSPKLIDDLLLHVDDEDLLLNEFDLEAQYFYFENYNDFLRAKDHFLNTYKYS